MNNKTEEKVKKLFVVGGVFIVVLLTVAFFAVHKRIASINADMENLVQSNIQVRLSSYMVEAKHGLFHAGSVMDLAVTGIHQGTLKDPEEMTEAELQDFLNLLMTRTHGFAAAYMDEKGQLLFDDGETRQLEDMRYRSDLKMASSGFFFTSDDGMQEKASFVYRGVLESGEEGKKMLLVYLDAEELVSSMVKPDYRADAVFALLNDRQTTLLLGGDRIGSPFYDERIWDRMRVGATNSNDWVHFQQQIIWGYSAYLKSVRDGETMFFFAFPMDEFNGTLILGVNQSFVTDEVSEAVAKSTSMEWGILGLFVLIVVVYLLFIIALRMRSKEHSRQLEDKAETDLLTGLTNKVSTENMIRNYIELHPNATGVFILVDVDNFKKVNDTMGHAFGDRVLKELGMRLRSLYRMTDIVGRIGGDEFLIFLKDLKSEEVVRNECKKLDVFFHGFEVGDYVKYSVGGSLGAAVYPQDGKTFEELYKNADAAVYVAKRAGKNRLVFYAEKDSVQISGAEPKRGV